MGEPTQGRHISAYAGIQTASARRTVAWSEGEYEIFLARKKDRERVHADVKARSIESAQNKARHAKNKARERDAQISLTRQLAASGLPEPTWEHRFAPPRRWRFDGAYPDSMIGFEIDGGTFSGGRHTRGVGYEKDCERDNEAAIAGWRVLRFNYAMIEDGRAAATIIKALQREMW